MYAICFKIDNIAFSDFYVPGSLGTQLGLVAHQLELFGFTKQSETLFFGNPSTTAIGCMLAISELVEKFEWFTSEVVEARILRVDEVTSLTPMIKRTENSLRRAAFDNVKKTD